MATDRDSQPADLPDGARRRLTLFADLVRRWQPTINLVSPSTLPMLWTRHIDDSRQVAAAVPAARRWVDLGAGGGFPGLVTAILLAEDPTARVDLIESDKRKAAFLRTVIRETGVPAIVHAERIETVVPRLAAGDADVEAVSARALAPLGRLVALAAPLLDRGAVGVFPKGENAEAELTAAKLDNRFRVESVPSRLSHRSTLLLIRRSDTV